MDNTLKIQLQGIAENNELPIDTALRLYVNSTGGNRSGFYVTVGNESSVKTKVKTSAGETEIRGNAQISLPALDEQILILGSFNVEALHFYNYSLPSAKYCNIQVNAQDLTAVTTDIWGNPEDMDYINRVTFVNQEYLKLLPIQKIAGYNLKLSIIKHILSLKSLGIVPYFNGNMDSNIDDIASLVNLEALYIDNLSVGEFTGSIIGNPYALGTLVKLNTLRLRYTRCFANKKLEEMFEAMYSFGRTNGTLNVSINHSSVYLFSHGYDVGDSSEDNVTVVFSDANPYIVVTYIDGEKHYDGSSWETV